MEEHDGVVVAPKKKEDKPGLKQPLSIDPAIAEQLVEQAGTDGVDLVGPEGLLGKLTKQVLEAGLDVEALQATWKDSSATTNTRLRAATAATHAMGPGRRSDHRDRTHRDCDPSGS